MKKENRLFVSIYSEDSFHGITIPKELEGVIEHLWENSVDTIDQIFEDYDDYRDYEVEISGQARDGSSGTKDIDTIEDLKEYFSWDRKTVAQIEEYENSK